MAVVRLIGVAFPIAVGILLIGVFGMWLSRVLGGAAFVGGVTPVGQALGGAWLAVIIALLIVRRLAANPERVQRWRGGGTAESNSRVLWVLMPSIVGASQLVEARLTGHLTVAVGAATLIVTALFTVAVVGFLKLRDRRRVSR